MIVLVWIVATGAVLLATAGTLKLLDPRPTGALLETLGRPVGDRWVRIFGAVEVVCGVAVLAMGGALATGVMALLYTLFGGLLVIARRAGATTSCGCFGRWSAPPGRRHIAVDLGAAGAAVVAAAMGAPALAEVIDTAGGGRVALVIAVLAGSIGLLVALTRPVAGTGRREDVDPPGGHLEPARAAAPPPPLGRRGSH